MIFPSILLKIGREISWFEHYYYICFDLKLNVMFYCMWKNILETTRVCFHSKTLSGHWKKQKRGYKVPERENIDKPCSQSQTSLSTGWEPMKTIPVNNQLFVGTVPVNSCLIIDRDPFWEKSLWIANDSQGLYFCKAYY